MKIRAFLLIASVAFFPVAQALAQTPSPSSSTPPTPAPNAVTPATLHLPDTNAAKAGDDDAQRLALANQMANLTPPRDAVDMVIRRIAASAPPADRATVRQRMNAAFDYDAFRSFVVKQMTETFTTGELRKMVEYHMSPEAQSIEHKMPTYEARIQPQMMKMLDAALMVARTGGKPEAGPGQTQPLPAGVTPPAAPSK